MKKKLLALLLTVAMGMSFLAGCGGAAASSAAKEPESSVPTEAPTAVESQTEPAPQEQEAVSVEEASMFMNNPLLPPSEGGWRL